ncbi:hypothetical protein IQ273_10005 [Nodosilinea sp. LEGE 07298]|uniref:hypothetical protein n=1 Tax=Nodosilinea sp. LEGE 07298 TaxID=2777970 RepID=UPI001881BA09|nr:hypothetical protein [Nodosilinea sp. LEGE 07298]MBE9109746.1 hypothetical protein [Nodosilinea sp. LEGE 07298]
MGTLCGGLNVGSIPRPSDISVFCRRRKALAGAGMLLSIVRSRRFGSGASSVSRTSKLDHFDYRERSHRPVTLGDRGAIASG